MLHKLKSLFNKETSNSSYEPTEPSVLQDSIQQMDKALDAQYIKQVQKLAQKKNFAYAQRPGERGYSLSGRVQDKAFKMERGNPSRDYIRGAELRARCELDLPKDSPALMIVNRALKTTLSNNTYADLTDTMETMANTNIPEEVMWISMYPEVGWPELSERFVSDYCILAEEKEYAKKRIAKPVVELLTTWPDYRITNPMLMMLLRGKLYFRMQFDDSPATLSHALDVFTMTAQSFVMGHDRSK